MVNRHTVPGFWCVYGVWIIGLGLMAVWLTDGPVIPVSAREANWINPALPENPLPPGVQSRTTEYLREQFARPAKGEKPAPDPRLAVPEFWDIPSGMSAQNAYRWPSFYIPLADNRTDTDGDGLRECRYKIDFSGFTQSG
nr:hypothetical protein [bacterium]